MTSTTQLNSASQANLSNKGPQTTEFPKKELSLFEQLPLDVHALIFSHLSNKSLGQISLTSKTMRASVTNTEGLDELNAIKASISFLAKNLNGKKKEKILEISQKFNDYNFTEALSPKTDLANIRKELIEEIKTLDTDDEKIRIFFDLALFLYTNGKRTQGTKISSLIPDKGKKAEFQDIMRVIYEAEHKF